MAAARLCLLLLLLAPAVWAPAARGADSTADEADVVFELGNEAYARGDYVEALRAYFQSYRLVPSQMVLFNIARSYEALGRHGEAYRYYATLSEGSLPAEDAAEVQRSLERLRPRVALLRVESEPRGAEVFLERYDLGPRGRTPLTLVLEPGRHRVMVRREGHRPQEALATLVRGRTVTQAFELVPATGVVDVSGTPAGAQVRVGLEGPAVGQLPLSLTLPVGRHVLSVSAPGHASAQLPVEVVADGTTPLKVALTPYPRPMGRLAVSADRAGASVRVDGRPAGPTPVVLTLPEGEYVVEVESPEVPPVRHRVTVVRDEETRLAAVLRSSRPPVSALAGEAREQDATAASTTVLTREELQSFGYTTLAEALTAVRGVFVGDDRVYTQLGMRGLASSGGPNRQLQVLWDGHPMNDPWAGAGFAGRELAVDLDEVERIEVVRGALSARHGSGALQGVVNVVPRDTLPSGRLELTAGLGAQGGTRGHLAGGWEADGRSVLATASLSRASGAFATRAPGGTLVEGLDAERAGGGSARARLGGLTLMAQVHQRTKDIPTAPRGTRVGAAGTRVEDSRGFLEARYERALSQRLTLATRAAFDASRYEGSWMRERGGQTVRESDGGEADWLSAEARLGLRLLERHELTVGLQGQLSLRLSQEVLAAGGEPRLSGEGRSALGLWVLDEWRVHPRLLLSAGARLDVFSDVDARPLSPRLAAVLTPYASGLTKLALGRAFRAPSPHERTFHDGGLTRAPASTLEPEVLDALELEHRHALSDTAQVTVAGYHQRVRGLVTLEAEGGVARCGQPRGSAACLVYRNADELMKTWGAEAQLHWQPARFLLLDVGYGLVTLRDAPSAAAGAVPGHLASARLLVPVAGSALRLAGQGTYQGARRRGGIGGQAGEALLLSLGVSGEHGRLRGFAGVQNLLDTRYALPVTDALGTREVPQYGRTFSLQVSGGF